MKKYILLLTVAVLCLSFQTFAQNGGVDETEAIDIGGIKQVISFKGKDATKPLLLYLHGASGNAASSVIAKAGTPTSKLQEHFVVVLWDQRDYGQTLALNKSPQFNLIKSIPSVKCPVYFFAGRKDFQTNARVTNKFYEKIKAPEKRIYLV